MFFQGQNSEKVCQKLGFSGTSQVAQWLRLCISGAEGAGFNPWSGNNGPTCYVANSRTKQEPCHKLAFSDWTCKEDQFCNFKTEFYFNQFSLESKQYCGHPVKKKSSYLSVVIVS